MSKYSRRSILKILASTSVAAAGFYPKHSSAIAPTAGKLNYGLLFDEADIDFISQNFESDLFADLRERLTGFDYVAEYDFFRNEIRYNDQLFTVARLASAIEEQAFLFLVSGDEQASEFVFTAVEELMKFERWDFFLDGDKPIGVQRAPYATLAVSLACDWLGEAVDDVTRKRWMRTMGERGLTACYN
ncbi:MAG: hypothetical protein HKN13_14520, partial [Rhodothermales bacterium]|nr:hypothetical protein [Rhodothermales bacterium]